MSEKLSHLEETQNRTADPEQRKGSVEEVQAPAQDVTRAATSQVLPTGRSPQEKAQDEVEGIKIKPIYWSQY